MGRAIIISGLLSVISFTGLFPQERVPVKHALVVAISEYSPGSGFRHIFADNDLKIILKLLQQQGFTDTIVLRNNRAGKQDFLRSFAKLRSSVHSGDIVFIHFSTHGQQIADLDNDEADDLDEAIALYDAKTSCSEGYRGQNHLTDDEFGSMIEQLRSDLGKEGDILVMIDACHSGSMTRGADTAHIRGGYAPILFETGRQSTVTRGDGGMSGTGLKKGTTGNRDEGMFSGKSSSDKEDLANYVILSACENNEVSSEFYYNRTYFGPLTWAFLNSMLSQYGENYTYLELFHDIQYNMISMFSAYGSKQHPTMESALVQGTGKVIFGGRNVRQQPFFSILSFIRPDRVLISGGILGGISDSTTLHVYPSGTMDPGRSGPSVSKGLVVRSGYMESEVLLDTPLDDKKPGSYWLFVGERRLNLARVRIGLGSFADPGLKQQVAEALKKYSWAGMTTSDPEYILRQSSVGKGELTLEYARGRKVFREPIALSALGEVLLSVSQARFLKELNVSAEGIRAEVFFLPPDTVRFSKQKFSGDVTQRPVCRERIDTAVLWIVNSGTKSFYFNVLDIDPEDHFSVFLPNTGRSVPECYLKPGQKFHAPITFNRPYGTEVLKILASEKKFDLRPVIHPSGTERGVMGDLEKAFSNAFSMRGASLPETAELATFNFFFDVIK